MAKPLPVSGDAVRYNPRGGNDDFTQPGNRFRLMTPEAQQRLFGNIARPRAGVSGEIQLPKICHMFRADPAYGAGVAHALGIDLEREMACLGISGNGRGICSLLGTTPMRIR